VALEAAGGHAGGLGERPLGVGHDARSGRSYRSARAACRRGNDRAAAVDRRKKGILPLSPLTCGAH
jgi:hypothetical protein